MHEVFFVHLSHFISAAYPPVNRHAQQRDHGRRAEDDQRVPEFPCSQKIAADGGGDNRGQPAQGTQNQPVLPWYVRQARVIAQQILRSARHDDIADRLIRFSLALRG